MGVKITKSNSNSLSPAIKSKFTYKSEPISSTYILGKTIGSGRYGIVRKALKNDSSEIFAIKRIKKNPDRETCYLTREVEIMKELSHKNIVKLIDTYEDQHFFFLVIEFCQEGDLSRKLKNRQKFSEEIAKIYMNQILKAIDYLHKNNILHRDIKPGNIMIHKNNELKLADFGLSKRFDKCLLFKTRAGTLSYMAPEVIKRKYSHKCDMWSAGIILFRMLSGNVPFRSGSDEETRKLIVKGAFDFKDDVWTCISNPAKDLIMKLLVLDPNKRIQADEALLHYWFQSLKISDSVTSNLENAADTVKIQDI